MIHVFQTLHLDIPVSNNGSGTSLKIKLTVQKRLRQFVSTLLTDTSMRREDEKYRQVQITRTYEPIKQFHSSACYILCPRSRYSHHLIPKDIQVSVLPE